MAPTERLSAPDLTHWANHYSLGPGDQTHVNHDGCPAGIDTKMRLYIKRLHDGMILGYCHHCGMSGNTRSTDHFTILTRETVVALSKHVPDNTPHWNEWSAAARGWVTKYGITEHECLENGITYAPDSQRVMLKVFAYDDPEILLGYQMRSVDANVKPKYRTSNLLPEKDHHATEQGYWRVTHPESTRLVIVEDILSAVKVSRYANALAMMGTNLSTTMLNRVVEAFETVHIWLDADKAGIAATVKIGSQLALFLGTFSVKLVPSKLQPKESADFLITGFLGP
jgi:hypothetical protein